MTIVDDIIATARAMNAVGLNQGRSGNLSVRLGQNEGLAITPSGIAYDGMQPSDIVTMAWDGSWSVEAPSRKPSSEWRFHRDVLLQRPEFGAVLHAHPIHATALACHGRGIGPFHYMVAIAGGKDIRCCEYALFGTQALSDSVLRALEGRKACLMAHHGLIACGDTPAQALELAVEVETLAAQYLAALALGEPPELSDEDMDAVLNKVSSGYGYGSA